MSLVYMFQKLSPPPRNNAAMSSHGVVANFLSNHWPTKTQITTDTANWRPKPEYSPNGVSPPSFEPVGFPA